MSERPVDKFEEFDRHWPELDNGQDSFDDVLFAEDRQKWARQRKCAHCYVWMYNSSRDMFAVACAHGCGSVRHEWKSADKEGDMARVKATQEAFVIAHAHGCPRDLSRTPGGNKIFGRSRG